MSQPKFLTEKHFREIMGQKDFWALSVMFGREQIYMPLQKNSGVAGRDFRLSPERINPESFRWSGGPMVQMTSSTANLALGNQFHQREQNRRICPLAFANSSMVFAAHSSSRPTIWYGFFTVVVPLSRDQVWRLDSTGRHHRPNLQPNWRQPLDVASARGMKVPIVRSLARIDWNIAPAMEKIALLAFFGRNSAPRTRWLVR